MLNWLKNLFIGPDLKAFASNGALIIDVRTREEFKNGHHPNSINIPLSDLSGKISDLKAKQKTIIACCQSGSRSSMAVSLLRKNGIDAYNAGSWTQIAALFAK
ncbi:MAG: rhodanese-like domain-containing protein [Bacteroidota bacterium]